MKKHVRLTGIFPVITVTLIMALILMPTAWASSYKVIHKFTGGVDGGHPEDALIMGAAGNLYGTTRDGGALGHGTVFKLIRNSDGSWTESVLHSFAGGSDGAAPWAGVTFSASGVLYGTTVDGGVSSAGTVFELVPNSDGSWTESVLYSFTGGSDGANPEAGVILDASGSLYGTTTGGGVQGQGVVYRLAHNSSGSWTYVVLHSFAGGDDGSYPRQGNLTFDTAGNLYGATGDGVDDWGGCPSDCGSLFELTPNSDGSWSEKVIFRFDGNNLGTERKPVGPMTFDSAGHLYGVTEGGGGWFGSVFKMTRNVTGDWTASVLHEFLGDQDGAYLPGSIVFDKSGNLYGTTFYGEDLDGSCCFGQVYTLIPRSDGSWAKNALHRFQGGPSDGSNTWAGVVLDGAGNLYGTTVNGGTNDQGIVFEVEGAALADTYFMIKSSANPALVHQPVTFTTTSIAHDKSLGAVTGTVTFKDGTTTLGTAPISGSHASITTSALWPGTHNIVAYYSGSTVFAPNAANLHEVITRVELSAASLDFGNQAVGTTSAPQTVTITNVGSMSVSISTLSVTGNFHAQSSTCFTILAGGATCTVAIVFHPPDTGTRWGHLWIYDDGGGSPQNVTLIGLGI